jgi:GAF domain-containing protein
MKLPFFRKPIRYLPTPQLEGSLQDFRERIITILLVSALTLGALAFIAAAIPAARTHQYWIIGLYAACYAWILIIAIQRSRFSYTIKIYSIAFIFYVLGLTNLVQSGLSADAGVFLLSFTVVISMMLGARSGIFALILSISTFALVGFLMSSGGLVPPVLTNFREPIDWVSGGFVLILLSTILTLSLNTILRGLNNSIAKERILAVDIDRDREQLRLRSQDLQRRLAQLRATADIEHTMSALLDPEDLMDKVIKLLTERFGLYHVGVLMLSDNNTSLGVMGRNGDPSIGFSTGSFAHTGIEVIYQTGTGNIVPSGHRLTLSESSTAGRVMINRKPRSAEVNSNNDAFTSAYLPLAHTELALPLLSQDHVIGVLMIHSTQSNAFDSDDIALFQSTADSLAVALENARLFKQNQDDLEEIRSLQKQYLRSAWIETEQLYGNLSYTYQAVPVNKNGAEIHEQDSTPEPNISTFSIPISLRDQTIGQFTLEAKNPDFSNEDRAFIESVIMEAALALDNARLLTETQQRADHDRLVAEVNRAVQSSTDIETILSSAIRELGQKLRASEAMIAINTQAEDADQALKKSTNEPSISSSKDNSADVSMKNSSQLEGNDPIQQEVVA